MQDERAANTFDALRREHAELVKKLKKAPVGSEEFRGLSDQLKAININLSKLKTSHGIS